MRFLFIVTMVKLKISLLFGARKSNARNYKETMLIRLERIQKKPAKRKSDFLIERLTTKKSNLEIKLVLNCITFLFFKQMNIHEIRIQSY